MLASGARRIEIIDPLGRRMMRDAGSGEDVCEITGATIEDISSEHDNGGDVDDPLTGYDIDIPIAFDGHYTVRVFAEDGLSLTASGYGQSGVLSSDGVADTTAGPTGNTYDVLYDAGSVVVSHITTLGVERTPSEPGVLRVLRCPTRGPVEFAVMGQDAAGDAVDVFDITGRKVDVVYLAPGATAVSWDWRRANCRPGVYLGRLRSRGSSSGRAVVLY
jgi:hypothetical protein